MLNEFAVLLMLATAAPAGASLPAAGAVRTSSHAESVTSSQSVHEVTVPASRAAVWAAISSADGWRGWAANQTWTPAGEPLVIESSYDPKAGLGDAKNIKSLIVLKVPGRALAFRTIKAPDDFADAEALTGITWLIELEEVDGGTRVRLTGSGYPRTPAGERILGFFMSHNPIALQALHDRFMPAVAAAGAQK